MRSQQAQTCQGCGIELVPGGAICPNCKQHYYSPPGVGAASWGIRFVATILDGLILVFTLIIGWIIWAIFTFNNGQTPGKAIVGIRAMNISGADLGWGMTFVREIAIKVFVIGIISNITFGIGWLVNYLWPLWDRNLQALHDKMIGTVVVKDGGPVSVRQQSDAPEPDDPWGQGGPAAGA